MTSPQEGELLLIEKYGSTERKLYYVRPIAQTRVVVVERNGFNIFNWLTQIFLPHGYPDSVSKDYLSYQIWDTAQAFCSTITGILATQEVFRGVGVGDTSATPLAATITWVMKDGFGHLGKILFAYTHGTYLDAYSKKWRLNADVLNDAAMSMEIALPLFRNYTTLVLCVSTVMKAIVGVAGGATRIAMTQHHAVTGNIADVSAKDSAQETFVNLVASMAALLILKYIGNSLMIFSILMVFHIIFNYLAVRAVCLRTLNKPRFLHVIDTYLRREAIPTPCEVNQKEAIISFGHGMLDLQLCGFRMKLGCSMRTLISYDRTASYLKSVREVYGQRRYILLPRLATREMYILFKSGATTDDILCAFLHGTLTAIIICAINDADLNVYRNSDGPKPFIKLCQTLRNTDWGRMPNQEMTTVFSAFKYIPSVELLTTLDQIFNKEWLRMKSRLELTGWDLSKHLLMVDEWRLCNYNMYRVPEINVKFPDDGCDDVQSIDKLVLFEESLSEVDTNSSESYLDDMYTIELKTPDDIPSFLRMKPEEQPMFPTNARIQEEKQVHTLLSPASRPLATPDTLGRKETDMSCSPSCN